MGGRKAGRSGGGEECGRKTGEQGSRVSGGRQSERENDWEEGR